MSSTVSFLADSIRSAWLPPFRGQIYEFAAGLDLQAGYSVKGFFDIRSAPWLIEPFEAIRDPRVRVVSIQAGVQTLKSLVEDITIPYWILHDPGDCLFLLDTDPKALKYCSSRLMPLIRSVPEIQRLLLDVDLHDKTKTKIAFHAMNLVVGGLNEGNCQSLSYRYVILDEAWMARANGLLRQAIYRTTQYQDTSKVLVVGQGGMEDEDADSLHKDTDQRELHFRCPFCAFAQPFDISRLRGEDHPRSELRGTYSGLSWDRNDTTRPSGRWNWEAVGRSAHIRCYQCDARIEDRPEVRRQLCDSYHFKPTNPGAPKELVGFHWPQAASPRIALGKLAVTYLKAKIQADELGYRLPLQEFYQKNWGLTWADDSATEHRAISHEPYDVRSEWPEEAHRCLIADCQRDLAKFFVSVFAVALSGEARELARVTCASFDEIAKVQEEWKVKDQHTFLDCGYEMTKVLAECVKRGHVGKIKIGGRVVSAWLCWTGMKGSGQEMFVHTHPGTDAKEWRIYSQRKFYDVNAGTAMRGTRAPWYEWSNLHAKDLLRPRRDGDPNVPKLRFLADTLPNNDPWSHFAQMRSERREEKFANGKKSARWVLIKESRPNHEWDKAAMLMAFMALVGIVGPAEGCDERDQNRDDSGKD
jgi:Phage terminase large subunit (GpA)